LIKGETNVFLKIGHRGAPGKPRKGENTIPSFRKALNLGANAIEFDVRKAKDGQLVVIHDLSVERTTGQKGFVREMTYKQLSKLNADNGACIPLLEEVLDLFGRKCALNIELKEQGLAENVLTLLDKYELKENIIISAFDLDDNDPDSDSIWLDLNQFQPPIKIGLLATKKKIKKIGAAGYVFEAMKRRADAINPENTATTPELVQMAHGADLAVYVWTVNNHRQIKKFKKMGVDGIFSDYPDRL